MLDPQSLIRPKRKIVGMSAILLPFKSPGQIDWWGFENHVARTRDAGLIPAVNMDTGYGNLIDESIRQDALDRTQSLMSGKAFLAGAFVADQPGAAFDPDGYRQRIDQIQSAGGTPIVFQSYGLASQADQEIVENYAILGSACDSFYAFELGTMFAPFGNIYSIEVYRELMKLPACVGAKHSSLQRDLEWQRIVERDDIRPDFQVLTGNDLAIDMVMYGSDYLLGLSTFCPDVFARRDALWQAGDADFYQLNDVLQYLGFFAFRHPTSAYKHNAAMFLRGRRWIASDLTHENSPERPASDYAILYEIGRQLGLEMETP